MWRNDKQIERIRARVHRRQAFILWWRFADRIGDIITSELQIIKVLTSQPSTETALPSCLFRSDPKPPECTLDGLGGEDPS